MTHPAQKKSQSNLVTVLKTVASLKLTVVCLVLLAALVVWGTVYQAEHGLYQAQQEFFHSWFFLILGFIPFPGTVLVMFVLFFNLVCSLFYRIGFRWANLGNIITHTGIIVLLVGGFFTFYYSQESSLVLKEGETGTMSSSNLLWELAVWEYRGNARNVYALDADALGDGDEVTLPDLGLRLQVMNYYKNCTAFTTSAGDTTARFQNASGIRRLQPKALAPEGSNNTAGILFTVGGDGGSGTRVLLYGRESLPTPVGLGGRNFYFSLRKKKFQLPLQLTLVDFRIKYYPNSQIPKSYESTVKMKGEEGLERDVVISMNKPLRYKDLTFFQSSYHIEPDGTEYSIFAVVKNVGRLLPYISSGWIFLGMMIHFLVRLFRKRKKNK